MLRRRLATLSLVLASGALAVAAVRPSLTPQMSMTPTEHHAFLLEDVGEWEGTLTSSMPGMGEVTVDATQTVEAVGKFWIQARLECSFMGMPYAGTGCIGYEPGTEKVVATWVDSMSTWFAKMEGEIDVEKKTLVLRWEAPNLAGEMTSYWAKTVRHDADSFTQTSYMGEGEGTKISVLTMKRTSKQPVEAGAGK